MASAYPVQFILEKMKNNKKGFSEGIFSICSANRYVIEASMRKAKETDTFLLIEATCNQVNQFGGYTGMTPEDFSRYIYNIADKVLFPKERVILGGDHLGPYPWRNQSGEIALRNSNELVRAYVAAGYKKIHIDASMFCQDDDHTQPLSKQLSADRAARICKRAEESAIEIGDNKPLYVIGTEVPLPGGQQESNDQVVVTSKEDIDETITIFRNTFIREGLESAWERVIAAVVQPGVEFSEDEIIDYQRGKAIHLKSYIEKIPRIVFEAHSTDYQTHENLQKMVEDHFAILKVGPALTFSFREAVFGLQKIEEELFRNNSEIVQSNLILAILKGMDSSPDNWKNYYRDNKDLEITKLFGFSDRIRYYWNVPEVERSLAVLLKNLKTRNIPLSLISQYLPKQFDHIRTDQLINDPEQLILDHIGEVINCYSFACNSKHLI